MNPQLRFTFLLILATACFLHADQNCAAPNLSAIATDFELTPMQKDTRLGGFVQFGFFLIGGTVSLFIGPLADQMDRVTLLSVVVCCGAVPSLLMGLSVPSSKVGFFYFFLARVCTGISIGGSFPVLYSLTSDLFPASQRSSVAAAVGACCNIGAALGGVMAGLVGPSYGWRVPYVCIALPAITLAVVSRVFLKDPRTKRKQEAGGAALNAAFGAWSQNSAGDGQGHIRMEDLDFAKFRKIGLTKTNLYVLAQSLPGCIPISVITTFLSDYLCVEQGMNVTASTGVTAVFGISCLVANFGGGTIGQALYNQSKEQFCMVIAATTACAAVPFIMMINSSKSMITAASGSPTIFAFLLAIMGGINAFAGPNIRATLMNVNSSNDRGTVFSAFTLCDDLGKGLGPMLVVTLIAIFGRQMAFTLAFACWFISSAILFMMQKTLPKDALRGGDSGGSYSNEAMDKSL